MRIIKATEAIPVEHPIFLIFGEPGIGKTSLGYSAEEALLIDADRGAHRAANRRDTVAVDTWKDIEEVTTVKDAIAAYKTLVPDTAGRVLDLLAAHIIEENPKYNRDGSLTLQGFGVLKARFQTWITRVRAAGKDVVLIAHHKEDKNGDTVIVRPDITGGSYHEVMKVADFVGYLSMQGKRRVLDFNPTDRWVGKNPAGWEPIVVPPVDKATTFLADLIARGRDALGAISAESSRQTQIVDDYRALFETYTLAEECNKVIPDLAALKPVAIQAAVKRLLADRAKALGFTFDPARKGFIAPTPVPAAVGVAPDLGF